MLLIPRYILRAHIGPFLFGTSVVMFLFLLQFLLLKLNELVGKGLGVWVITQLVTLNLAWMLVLAVPMGVLFSTLMAFGQMSSASEVTIIKASGAGLLRMMLPVLIAGAAVTYVMFWFNDEVLPDANHRAKVLLIDIQRKKPSFAVEAGQFTTQLDGYTILARSVDSSNGLMRGVTIYDRTNAAGTNVVSADSGTIRFTPDYNHVIIMLLHGEIHQIFKEQAANYRKIDFEAHQIVIPASGFMLERSSEGAFSRGDREMKIADMQVVVDDARKQQVTAGEILDSVVRVHCDYLLRGKGAQSVPPDSLVPASERIVSRVSMVRNQMENSSYQFSDGEGKARQYLVEIYKKYAIPCACFVFVFIGCPLGILTRGGSFGISAAISLAFYILYWACLIGGEKLADRQLASPLAMWLANAVLGIIGLLLTFRINNESLGITFISRGVAWLKSLFTKPPAEVVADVKD